MSLADRAWDIYDGEDIHGSRLVRLTKADVLEGTTYRHTFRGTGFGRIVLRRAHSARQYLVRGHYVRCVNLTKVGGGEEVDGGFFLDEGEEIVLSDRVTQAFTIGGPSTLAYLARARLDNVTRSPSGGSGDQTWIDTIGARRWWGPGLRQGFDNIIKRLIVEAWLLPTNPIPALFGALGAGAGNSDEQLLAESAISAPDGYFDSPVGANLLDEIMRILHQGALDIWIDPDTFLIRVVDFDTIGTVRTGGAFGAGVVRFQGGANIAADLRRAVHHSDYASHIIAMSPDRLTVVVVADPDWSSGDPIRYEELVVDIEDVTTAYLTETALKEIELRKFQTDEASFPHLYGADEAAGAYTPSDLSGTGHYAPGDYVTLHTGSAAGDYNEETIEVAAVNWVQEANGLYRPWPELGGQYTAVAQAALDRRLGGIGTGGLRLCPPGFACENIPDDYRNEAVAVNGDAEATGGGEWGGGGYQTLYAHGGTYSYGILSSATPTLVYTWNPAQVFSAGVRYVLDMYAKQGEGHVSYGVKFGVAGGDEVIGETHDLGGDAGWERHRICWTPTANRTGVRFEWAEVQSPADYFLIDDLTLWTTIDDLRGKSAYAAHCDHGHRAQDVSYSNGESGLVATDVQAAIDEIVSTGVGGLIEVAEADGSPDVADVARIEFDGPTVTDDGGGQVTVAAASPVHSHGVPDDSFHGALVQRTTNFATANSNDNNPDFDTVLYDTDGLWSAGAPERITVPASWDGLMAVMHVHAGFSASGGGFVELKLYRNIAAGSIGTGNEDKLVGVAQHTPNAYNDFIELVTPPLQVADGDFFVLAVKTASAKTALAYFTISLTMGAYLVEPGEGDAGPQGDPGEGVPAGGTVGQALVKASGTDYDTEWVDPATGGGGLGALLLADDHSGPIVFGDILQADDFEDFLYADES